MDPRHQHLPGPSIYSPAAVEEAFRARRIDPQRLRRLRNVFFKRQGSAAEALASLPEAHRRPLAGTLGFHVLALEDRRDSGADGATKLVFRTAQGLRLETVILRIASGRTALCVSSQVGCAARCAFCATGRMDLVRDLSAAEILDQVVQANQLLRTEGRRARNIVFMGMGEPFHNEKALYEAIEILRSPECFAYSDGRLLVSTVGVPDAMTRCARRFPRVSQALSLHGARPGTRERIVPIARVHGLPALRQTLVDLGALLHRPVLIEYLLLKGVNDADEDLEALAEYLAGLSVHVNLIPYNPIAGAPELEATPRARRETFAAALRLRGFKVTVRYSLGADVGAACGQLANAPV